MRRIPAISLCISIFIWAYGSLISAEHKPDIQEKEFHGKPEHAPEKNQADSLAEPKIEQQSDTLNPIDNFTPEDSTESNWQIPRPPFHKFYRFMYIHRKNPIGFSTPQKQMILSSQKNFS